MKAATIINIGDHALVRTFCGSFSDMDHLDQALHAADRPYAKPAVNIAETATAYMLELTLPGYRKGDLRVRIEDDMLTISGMVSCVPEHYEGVLRFYKKEFSVESFTRTFLLPEDFDKVSACLKDGILFIYLTKGRSRRPANGMDYEATIPVN